MVGALQLGINLMRLGQEDEPRKQLEMCYDNGYRDAATVNSLRLLDSYKNFVTFETTPPSSSSTRTKPNCCTVLSKTELKRAIATYEKKYKMTLPGPVQVEVYPGPRGLRGAHHGNARPRRARRHVRRSGGDGQPLGAQARRFNWASTLWHEMSHVYILTATNHRVPRWFTEGLAVHEETQASPEWGDRDDAGYRRRHARQETACRSPISIAASCGRNIPTQVIVSYFQAGRICDYIQSSWGEDKLLDMVHSFARTRQHAATPFNKCSA